MLIGHTNQFIRLSEQVSEVNSDENWSRIAPKDATSLTTELSTNGMHYQIELLPFRQA